MAFICVDISLQLKVKKDTSTLLYENIRSVFPYRLEHNEVSFSISASTLSL